MCHQVAVRRAHFLAHRSGMLGYIISSLIVIWCSYSASSIFASVLHLSHQRFLVAYPVGLLCVSLVSSGSTAALTLRDCAGTPPSVCSCLKSRSSEARCNAICLSRTSDRNLR